MNMHDSDPVSAGVPGGDGFVDLRGRRFYRIGDYGRLEPFFMTVVGAGDAWLFISSSGGLTAGRQQPESALFPYYTDDKVSESAGGTGGLSLLRVRLPGTRDVLWEPFLLGRPATLGASRNLYKDVAGSALVFEEEVADLGLRLRVTWQTSNRFGIVRTCELTNIGDESREVEFVDGFVNLLPAGVGVAVQNTLSNLLDAYKRSEVDTTSGLGMYWLSSRLTDLAEPSESLHANVAWHVGLGDVQHLASSRQLTTFRHGGDVVEERDVRGERGAYLVHTSVRLAPAESKHWSVVGDVELDAADVVGLRRLLERPSDLASELEAELLADSAQLERIVASVDGLQRSGDELATAHHLANALFNVMRGGVPADGYEIDGSDVRAFIEERSPQTAQRCTEFLDALPAHLRADALVERARDSADPDLVRLALEYLPLTFSRRHGDPSRPWNAFRIDLRDELGNPRLSFQGNWRDIFQNWEAMAWSFPEYLESMVAVFVNATTADGYNPYRISRSGVDWEVPEPDNPWANIGYWSDHQIIYLLRLLETSHRFHPGRLRELVGAEIFTHADVPYRLASYERTLRDPRSTVAFDDDRAALIRGREGAMGADGRLVVGPDGDLLRVTLAEKLLLLLLAKLVNFVPDGGIWMNTQRPEWNDANNALVGWGLSVVTLAQLRRYVGFVKDLIAEDVRVTEELAELLDAVTDTLDAHVPQLEAGFSDETRRTLMDGLGAAGTDYRERVYQGFSGGRTVVAAAQVHRLLDAAQQYVEASLRSNERDDALFHSYNLLDLSHGAAAIRRLPVMLEGQVAVLSSGQLTAAQSLALLAALRASPLYRHDQHSYLLYPDKDLAGFLDRNRFTADRADNCAIVTALLDQGDARLVVRDVSGDLHFAAGIRHARDVEAVLDALTDDPDLGDLAREGRSELLEIFGEVFNHAEFTGRSGSFFAYEGLGSIYWHMVSKLLLAVQETLERAVAADEDEELVAALVDAYEDIRAGLGYCKPAEVYGAFPTDPYSHTPAGRGAKQPGMTGQVKEEVLTRLGELGVRVEDGCIVVHPIHLRASEWLLAASTFEYIDVRGSLEHLDLPAGSLAFTFCQVPVVYHQSGTLTVRVHQTDGTVVECSGGRVPPYVSAGVFGRRGRTRLIEVHTPASG